MNTNDSHDLLNRIKKKDVDAYLQLMSLYGGKVHTRLLQRIGDRDVADAVFRKTLTSFYEMLTKDDSEDALETLLNFYADSVYQQTKQVPERPVNVSFSPPGLQNEPPKQQTRPTAPVEVCQPDSKPEQGEQSERASKSGGIGLTFGIVIMVLCILVVIWAILGLLMDVGILPQLDLGYSWFNIHIAPWF